MSPTASPTLARVPGRVSRDAARTSELYVTATHKVRDRNGRPPYRWVPHLRLMLGTFATTSVGIVVKRGRG